MFKVLLVDDEPLIRRGLKEKLDWNSLGFEIAGEASNGLQALELVKKINPDIILTDMKMPVMDGIKLLQAIKAADSRIKVIVISAYSSFQYTQTAVKCGAFDYILKPIDSDELTEVLARARLAIESEISSSSPEHPSDFGDSLLPEVKERFLNSFISSGIINRENLELSLSNREFSSDIKQYLCLVVMIPELTEIVKEIFEDDYTKAFICLTNLIQNFSHQGNFSITAFRNPMYVHNFYVILGVGGQPVSTAEVIEDLKNKLESFLQRSVVIGVGSTCMHIYEIGSSFVHALDALSYRSMINESCIIFSEDLKRQNFSLIHYSSENENAFLTSLEICNYEEMEHNLNQLFQCIRGLKEVSFRQIYKLFSELLFLCDRVLRKYEISLEQVFSENITSIDYIACKGSLSQLENWFSDIVINIMHSISDRKSSNMGKIIDEIKDYIDTHYFEDLSLNDMSQNFFINKSYLSELFKKRIGQTFLGYLTSVRMNKAVELLSANTTYKVYEIARLVGYEDGKYFSKLFRNFKGITPDEFKRCHRDGGSNTHIPHRI